MVITMASWRAKLAVTVPLAWLAASCGGSGGGPDCLALPCPMPMAVIVTVVAAGGGAVPDLTMTVSGATSATGPCSVGTSDTTCYVPGTAGTYTIRLNAPGFQENVVSVTVSGTQPPCGCASVETERASVVLSRG